MRRRITIPLVALVVVATLAVTAGTGTANHLSISSGSWRIIWPQVVFREPGWTVTCRMTLGGTFVRTTFTKTESNQRAQANEGSIAGCSGGSARLTPGIEAWMYYGGFTGALPNITGLITNWSIVSVTISGLLFSCGILTSPEEPAVIVLGREPLRRLISAEFKPEFSIRPDEGVTCRERWTISGSGEVWVLGTGSLRFSLTLI